jgi:branched-chain amino acid transport system substrate-binding protein
MVFGGGALGGFHYLAGHWPWQAPRVPQAATEDANIPPLPALPTGAAEKDETRYAAVVTIQVRGDGGNRQGTGFFIDSAGHVVTAAHVVEGTTCVSVLDQNGRVHQGSVLGTDRIADVALIRLSVPGAIRTYLSIASDAALRPGQPILVLAGNRVEGAPSEQKGTIRRTGVDLTVDDRYLRGQLELDGIQTVRGSSGGPVLDAATGKVVGLVVAGASGTVSYALPLQRVTTKLEEWAALTPASTCSSRPVGTLTPLQLSTISPLSGAMGIWGTDLADGAELAIRDMESELQRVGFRVTLRRLDDQGAVDQAAQQTAVAADDPRVFGVIGSLTNPLSNTLAKGLASSGKPLIIPASPAEYESGGANPPGVYRLIPSVSAQMSEILSYVSRRQRISSLLIVDDGTPLGDSRVSALVQAAKAQGVLETDRLSLKPDLSLADAAKRLEQSKADVIYYAGNAGSLIGLMQNLQQRRHLLIGGPELSDKGFEALPASMTDGMLFTYPVTGPTESFAAHFQSVLGKPTAGLSPYGYDAARILLEALVDWGEAHPGQVPTGADIDRLITNRPVMQGVTGPIHYTKLGENEMAVSRIYTWRDRALEPVKTN